jgi:hypothetical protein
MMDDIYEDASPEEIWPETLRDCPPPRRWPNDTVDSPMSPVQQQHYDQILAAACIPPWNLSDTTRLVLRWVAAGDSTVCGGLVELLERVRDGGFDEASDLAFHPALRGRGDHHSDRNRGRADRAGAARSRCRCRMGGP